MASYTYSIYFAAYVPGTERSRHVPLLMEIKVLQMPLTCLSSERQDLRFPHGKKQMYGPLLSLAVSVDFCYTRGAEIYKATKEECIEIRGTPLT
jgi:hypothetical protein